MDPERVAPAPGRMPAAAFVLAVDHVGVSDLPVSVGFLARVLPGAWHAHPGAPGAAAAATLARAVWDGIRCRCGRGAPGPATCRVAPSNPRGEAARSACCFLR